MPLIDSYLLDNYGLDGPIKEVKMQSGFSSSSNNTISNLPFKPYLIILSVSGYKSDGTTGSTDYVTVGGTIGAYLDEGGNARHFSSLTGSGYYGSVTVYPEHISFGENDVTYMVSYNGYKTNNGVNYYIFGV
ncbi:hypothetical protein SAMN05428961_104387 [Paenibacillus sp. OK060]|uniref:hypothetical protein n=1 Tax=Paenibacillus sp. OK060 TaxID=1881034 RepID=UPI0008861431|nr:hypothetical protein [Paenibacillus sp. OK060]SDL24434.1 hypothetical protein SAMN05428961_104387 [Paenibacillus sp. OK060]